MFILRLIIFNIVVTMIFIKAGYCFRCRTDDGPSDGELKRVARSCMRKFGDVVFAQNLQQQQQTQYYQQQQAHARYRQRVTNKDNYSHNYEDSEESGNDEFDDDQYYNNQNGNSNKNNHQQNGNSNNNHNNYDRAGGQGNNNDDRQPNRSKINTNNENNNNNNWRYLTQQNNNRANSNSNNNNSNRNKNNNFNHQNNSASDAACIVHCFFNEMHMLNNNDYPDRHKMVFILTKDLRDRELRNFYTDTIQECFRYIENQRRRDKCQFSRDLITCMTEYAKGNCEDWNEFNMVFN